MKVKEAIRELYNLSEYEMIRVKSHEGGRNLVYVCRYEGEPRYVVRISITGDRREQDYQAELEFVHYLAQGGASVADVLSSENGKLVEKVSIEEKEVFVSCFTYAKEMLISDNGYRYRGGAPLSEYFFNTGKALGKIHQLSF